MSDFLGSTSVAASIVLLLIGAAVTVGVSALSILLGFVIAVPVCIARLSPMRLVRLAGGFYAASSAGFRCWFSFWSSTTPLPSIGLELPSFLAATTGLAVCTAAYQAENLRGGFLVIPPGQIAAARAFGYGGAQIWRHILLPQALRAAAPSVVNEMIAILKASSLVSVVGVAELTRVSQNIVARDLRPIQWYGLAALFYLAISLAVSALGRGSERRLGRGRLQASL